MRRIILFVLPVIMVTLIIFSVLNDQTENGLTNSEERKIPTGRILQFGVYELVREGKLVESSVTTTGKAISKPTIQQVEQTDRIPAKKDVYFSYQYRLSNLPTSKPVVNLKRVLIHPEITLPDGSKKTGSEYFIKGKLKRGEVFAFDGYAFSENYEIVEGDWIFQIWYENQKLIEQKFTSYKPQTGNG